MSRNRAEAFCLRYESGIVAVNAQRIEFKQIIGRGTRLFDEKDYFTIYDFVKAYEHFSDPEWDGEPVEPTEAKPKKSAEAAADTSEGEEDGPTESFGSRRHRNGAI